MPPLSPASEYATGLGHRDKGSWDATALLHMDTDLGVSQLLSMIKGGEGGVTLATAELPVPAMQRRRIQQLGRQIPEPDKNIHRASVDFGDAPSWTLVTRLVVIPWTLATHTNKEGF